MKRSVLRRSLSASPLRILGAAFLAAGLLVPLLRADAQPGADSQPALTLKGSCVFHGTRSTWSATLTPKGENVYDAAYTCTWNGKPLTYKGTIKTDLKTTVSGDGKSTNKNGNGTFEFSGKFGDDGVAQCPYKEVGGGRSGSLTVEITK